MKHLGLRLLSMLATFTALTGCTSRTAMPDTFVALKDVDPTILQSVHYGTPHNFTGAVVPGYTPTTGIYCTRLAAERLKNVQEHVNKQGYTLVVYDGYRPQRAVDSFKTWTLAPDQPTSKAQYYPTVDKKEMFNLGYLAKKSSHSRGSTFDLTLIPTAQSLTPPKPTTRTLTSGEVIPYLDDNTLDMGTSFDLFHEASHHESSLVSKQALANRAILLTAMSLENFRDLYEEWWHYTLADEPYPDTYFNFVVE